MSFGTVSIIITIVSGFIGLIRSDFLVRRRCRATAGASGNRCSRRSVGLVSAYCHRHRTAPAYHRPRSGLGASLITGGSLWVFSFLLPSAERKCWSAEVRSVLWESRDARRVQRQQARGFLWALPATIWTSWMVVVLGTIRPRREFR